MGAPLDAAATEDCLLRKRVVVGEVHDLNAAVLGGKSTHAGLFGSASALTKLLNGLWMPITDDAMKSRLQPFNTSGNQGSGSHCLGWDTPSDSGSTASDPLVPKNGVGHLGFTAVLLYGWRRQKNSLLVLYRTGFTPEEGGGTECNRWSPRQNAIALSPQVACRNT